jgi:hypothetical protein
MWLVVYDKQSSLTNLIHVMIVMRRNLIGAMRERNVVERRP